MHTTDSFGDWVRRRREALSLTRPELAACAGCAVSSLRKIEADEQRPSRQLAELLAGCLHIAPDEQAGFVAAARGIRLVASLGEPVLGPPPTYIDARRSGAGGNLPVPATPCWAARQNWPCWFSCLTTLPAAY